MPSIWDAIDAGRKPLPPKRPTPPASPAPAARPAISYAVPKDEPIHSYAVVFRFRSEPIKGTAARTLLTINATDVDGAEYGLTLSMVPAHTEYGWGVRHVPAAFAYTSPIGGTATAHGIKTNGTMKDDGEWHEVALSHFWANQTTNMYLDGELVGQLAAERATPFLFTLSPTTPAVRRSLALS